MKLFRISRDKYIRDLSGEGARLLGGRWNPKGVPVIYTSTHESLAALETLVHSPIANLPDDLKIATLNIPEDLQIKEVNRNSLPDLWHKFPAPPSLKTIGEEWIKTGKYLGLMVPSAVIPSESNVLLNLHHDASDAIHIENIRPFSFDSRLPL